jgi:hypothetical protein
VDFIWWILSSNSAAFFFNPILVFVSTCTQTVHFTDLPVFCLHLNTCGNKFIMWKCQTTKHNLALVWFGNNDSSCGNTNRQNLIYCHKCGLDLVGEKKSQFKYDCKLKNDGMMESL